MSEAPVISVIIPALNEARHLPTTLACVVGQPAVEVIVVDGGSTDQTVVVVERAGAKLVRCEKGRAIQMNRGVGSASADVMLFCYADTKLPAGFATVICDALDDPHVVGGAFSFAVDAPGFGMRLMAWCVNLRSRLFRLPYGDQALFVRRTAFEQAGGYPELPIMEDFALVRRLRKLGRLVILDERAITSGRRWRNLGLVRTTLINQAIIVGYHLGVSPARLTRWYRGSDAGGSPICDNRRP